MTADRQWVLCLRSSPFLPRGSVMTFSKLSVPNQPRTSAAIEPLEARQLLATAGSLDTTFGSGGKAKAALGIYRFHANQAALQSDGKILVAGGAQWPVPGGPAG